VALLSSARSIGVIGSIMALLIIIPGAGSVLAIVGWVLVLVAVNQVSGITGDRSIVKNVLVAAVLGVAGAAVGVIVVLGSLAKFAGLNGIGGLYGLSSFSRLNGTTFSSGNVHGLGSLVVGVIGALVVVWIFLIVASIFLRRGYSKIAQKLNAKMFATSGLIFLIGAALTIVGVGLLLIYVAEILQVVAFFSLPDEVPGQTPRPVPMTVPPPPPPVT
jgi:uncharacterized membrane protein